MRAWLWMLGGLVVWTAHFFAVYGAGSLFPGQPIARWLTLAITVVAASVAAWLCWRCSRAARRQEEGDDFSRWMAGLSAFGSGLAVIAVLYGGAPALLS